jgi:hypothetical protein
MISRKVSQYETHAYRKYHRTQRRITTSWKCRPRNSAGRFWLTDSPYQIDASGLQQNPAESIMGVLECS